MRLQVVPKVLPPTKNCLHRLSLIRQSGPPPTLQALGEILFDAINEDVISVVGDASRASATNSFGLAISVHGARIRWKEIWKSGNLEIWIWKANKSGTVGRPTVPAFLHKVRKSQIISLEKIWPR
jgi:hypothetical protein